MVNSQTWYNIHVSNQDIGLDFNGFFSVYLFYDVVAQFFNSNNTHTNILLPNTQPNGNKFISNDFTSVGTYINKTILPQDFPQYNSIEVVNLWNDGVSNHISYRIDDNWFQIEGDTIFVITPGSDPNRPPPTPIEPIIVLPIRDTRAPLGGKHAIAYLGINSFSNRQLKFDRRHFRP